MPRGPRLHFENAFYHVFNRGVAKQPIFLDDSDHHNFLLKLLFLKTKKHFDHSIYSYVLMPNHFHLLIQTRKIPISKIMASLLTSYSMYFNIKHKRVGTLFQNRFKSKLCQKESYFLEASRYIHLNPLRAKLCSDLEKYPWSSYHELFGNSSYAIIEREEVSMFIGDRPQEKNFYLEFLQREIEKIDEMDKIFSFEKDIEGSAAFSTLSQKKYLRRI